MGSELSHAREVHLGETLETSGQSAHDYPPCDYFTYQAKSKAEGIQIETPAWSSDAHSKVRWVGCSQVWSSLKN